MERFDESIGRRRDAPKTLILGQRNSLRRAYLFSRRFDLYLAEEERTFLKIRPEFMKQSYRLQGQ
jgi:hypothetical protein